MQSQRCRASSPAPTCTCAILREGTSLSRAARPHQASQMGRSRAAGPAARRPRRPQHHRCRRRRRQWLHRQSCRAESDACTQWSRAIYPSSSRTSSRRLRSSGTSLVKASHSTACSSACRSARTRRPCTARCRHRFGAYSGSAQWCMSSSARRSNLSSARCISSRS